MNRHPPDGCFEAIMVLPGRPFGKQLVALVAAPGPKSGVEVEIEQVW